jgi:hypothetical protein
MFRSCQIIIMEFCSLLKLCYSIHSSIGICKRGVVAAYRVVWGCVVEQWLGVRLMCCGAVARCASCVLWSQKVNCVRIVSACLRLSTPAKYKVSLKVRIALIQDCPPSCSVLENLNKSDAHKCHVTTTSRLTPVEVTCRSVDLHFHLTFWRPNFFFNFSTSCV